MEYFRGIRGIRFIWHGTNADPELSYRGKTVNYWDVENTLWEEYKEDRQEKGLLIPDDQELFDKYCQEHSADIKQLIEDIWNQSRK